MVGKLGQSAYLRIPLTTWHRKRRERAIANFRHHHNPDRDAKCKLLNLTDLVWKMDVAVPVTSESALHAQVRLGVRFRHRGTLNLLLRNRHLNNSLVTDRLTLQIQ